MLTKINSYEEFHQFGSLQKISRGHHFKNKTKKTSIVQKCLYPCKAASLNNTKRTLHKSDTRYRGIGGIVKTENTPTFSCL